MLVSKKEILEDLDNFDKELQDLEKRLKEMEEEYNGFKDLLDLFGQALLDLTDKYNNLKAQYEKDINQMKKDNENFKKSVNDILQKNIEEMKKDLYWNLEKEIKNELKDRLEILKKELMEEIGDMVQDLVNNISQDLKQKITEDLKQQIPEKDQSGQENKPIAQEFPEIMDQGSLILEKPEIQTKTNEEKEDLEDLENEEPEDPHEKLLLNFLKEPHSFKELMDFAYQNHFSLARIFQRLQKEGKVKKTREGLWIRS